MGRLEAMVTGVHAILIDMDRDKLCLIMYNAKRKTTSIKV